MDTPHDDRPPVSGVVEVAVGRRSCHDDYVDLFEEAIVAWWGGRETDEFLGLAIALCCEWIGKEEDVRDVLAAKAPIAVVKDAA